MFMPSTKYASFTYIVVTWLFAAVAFWVGHTTASLEAEIVHLPATPPSAPAAPVPCADTSETEDPLSETEPEACPPPESATETIDELVEQGRYDAVIERCEQYELRWSPICEGFDLKIARAIREATGSRAQAITFLADRKVSFLAYNYADLSPPNVSFTQAEAVDVTEWCAVARQTQPEACRGIEEILATGMFASGVVLDIPAAYTRMAQIGVKPQKELQKRFYREARNAYNRGSYGRVIRLCEHGVEHGEQRCVMLLGLAYEKEGERERACQVFRGVPSQEVPFRCIRGSLPSKAKYRWKTRFVTKEVLERKMKAYEEGEGRTDK